jgi:4-aminobutyrate aminotransferase/(S)-3-amino-2-methylpropionate transaminase
MIAVELVDEHIEQPDPALAGTVARAAHQQGVIVLTRGTHGNVLRFRPPLSICDELLLDGLVVGVGAVEAAR